MEMDFSPTQCLMTHYCGRPPKIDEIDILSWLTRLMGLPIKPDCSFTHAWSLPIPFPPLHTPHPPPPPTPWGGQRSQVHSGGANPSRLTVIIRVIRSADIWYGASLSSALAHFFFQSLKWICPPPPPPPKRTTTTHPPSHITIYKHMNIHEIFFLFSAQPTGRPLFGFSALFCLASASDTAGTL